MCAPVRHARCAGLCGRKQPNPTAISRFLVRRYNWP